MPNSKITPQLKAARKFARGYKPHTIDPEIRDYVNRLRKLPCFDKESGGTLFSCAGFGTHVDEKGEPAKKWNDDLTSIVDSYHEPAVEGTFKGMYAGYIILVFDPDRYDWKKIDAALRKVSFHDPNQEHAENHWENTLGKPVKMYNIVSKLEDSMNQKWNEFVSTAERECAGMNEKVIESVFRSLLRRSLISSF